MQVVLVLMTCHDDQIVIKHTFIHLSVRCASFYIIFVVCSVHSLAHKLQVIFIYWSDHHRHHHRHHDQRHKWIKKWVIHNNQSGCFFQKSWAVSVHVMFFKKKMGEVSLSLLQLYQAQQKQQQLKLNFSFVKNQIVGMKFKCGAIFC